jgi:shikimate dehydrogenase
MADQYCVFGNPIAQSKSPDIHRQFAQQTGEAVDYSKQLVDVDGFETAAKTFFEGGGCGLNITVPFKLDAYQFADQLTERAKNAGAVNTLKRLEDGKIIGDNTDGQGLVSDITEHLGWPVAGKRVLILGAGGAVRGVLQPLLEQRPQTLVIANRTLAKAEGLADEFSNYGEIKACEFSALMGQQFDLVINATSAGLAGELPPLPNGLLADAACCYDMIYGAEPTVFLQWAKQQRAAQVADGIGMLVGQAAQSFKLWRGVLPLVAPVIEAQRALLS